MDQWMICREGGLHRAEERVCVDHGTDQCLVDVVPKADLEEHEKELNLIADAIWPFWQNQVNMTASECCKALIDDNEELRDRITTMESF